MSRREGRAGLLKRLLPDAPVEPALPSATHRGGRILAWCVVVASPLVTLGGLIVLRPTPPVSSPSAHVETEQRDPRGWTEMYVRSWLAASRDDPAGLAAFYPDGMASQRDVGTQIPVDTAVVSVVSPAPGTWSVVVAVNLLTEQPDGSHPSKITCEQVSLVGGRDAYVATELPSPVACPGTLAPVELAYDQSADLTGPIGQSVGGFLTAYLVGQGQLDRYTSPGASLAPVVPAPYMSVQLQQLRTHEDFEPGQAARPLDGTQTHVLTRALGYDATGQNTAVDYALTLTARAGRWEVSSVDASPLLVTPSVASPVPSSVTRGGS
ncbi:conjugal transfer protein [Amycolatopsis carbonis]|uniref:Conjugal transfer protein n=1 Tax=Amycolatopsis carbonis TaxID=715471 RepID=A0A9Y2IPI1_9PSEU|nr:conjugal transfer protein [Amycolatopsis sp. 2-15]WIX82920.1 conjugal transfer protein [Amycolatopsis sp. 2-15]